MEIFDYQPPAVPWLDIRYIDRNLIIINKPSGLLSNPGMAAHTHDSAITRLCKLYPEAILVHRLDCATSGIMVFARSKKAESNLKTQFQHRETEKRYLAEVAGLIEQDEGTINLPLGKDRNNPPWQKVDKAEGRPAVTHYRVIERREGSTLVALEPETGRTHQLRVHMLAIGHPILGDDFYGRTQAFGTGKVAGARPRLCLHAERLSFKHPWSGKPMTFISRAPF
ncbi:RluA family pseudouridine synthase [Shewanella litorisediminis]|uniref:Pseudouridine synthase n=1 Tax=Shewanella litorisediminis TaxID=1173586 RepID=A0ABX7FZL7_9GAMM|nr:RluA family pseudouridine synthase [Shewanella litorisediminis]MCL2919487.1 RluA family pseudouridine synthase [Shewanella litorisediminis]QRH00474.1 RluA family pseudouridine synthase [Shewanella litorisediminis]